MTEKTENPDAKLVVESAEKLIEHFDSVAIFVTRHEPCEGGTFRLVAQRGNIYSNLGWVGEWLEAQHAITRARSVQADQQGGEHD